MANESIQKKLTRVRPPRVQITYDVQVGDAIEKRELPFVVGVMSDLSGHRDPNVEMPKLKDRKFINIDRDNIDQVMEKINPRLVLRVKNTLQNDDKTELSAELTFSKMSDFEPQNVVEKIPALKHLLQVRQDLKNLRSTLYGNDKAEQKLLEVLRELNPEKAAEMDKAAEEQE